MEADQRLSCRDAGYVRDTEDGSRPMGFIDGCSMQLSLHQQTRGLSVEKLREDDVTFKSLKQSVLSNIHHQRKLSCFKVNSIYEIFSPKLQNQYNKTRKLWRSKGYNEEAVADCYGYLDVSNESVEVVNLVCHKGLRVANIPKSVLGDPKLAVQLSRHPDVVRNHSQPSYTRTLMMFKVMKGRVKVVGERDEIKEELRREPTYLFDTHVCSNQGGHRSYLNFYLARMLYVYNYSDDDQITSRPRQVCPIAFVELEFRDKDFSGLNMISSKHRFSVEDLIQLCGCQREKHNRQNQTSDGPQNDVVSSASSTIQTQSDSSIHAIGPQSPESITNVQYTEQSSTAVPISAEDRAASTAVWASTAEGDCYDVCNMDISPPPSIQAPVDIDHDNLCHSTAKPVTTQTDRTEESMALPGPSTAASGQCYEVSSLSGDKLTLKICKQSTQSTAVTNDIATGNKKELLELETCADGKVYADSNDYGTLESVEKNESVDSEEYADTIASADGEETVDKTIAGQTAGTTAVDVKSRRKRSASDVTAIAKKPKEIKKPAEMQMKQKSCLCEHELLSKTDFYSWIRKSPKYKPVSSSKGGWQPDTKSLNTSIPTATCPSVSNQKAVYKRPNDNATSDMPDNLRDVSLAKDQPFPDDATSLVKDSHCDTMDTEPCKAKCERRRVVSLNRRVRVRYVADVSVVTTQTDSASCPELPISDDPDVSSSGVYAYGNFNSLRKGQRRADASVDTTDELSQCSIDAASTQVAMDTPKSSPQCPSLPVKLDASKLKAKLGKISLKESQTISCAKPQPISSEEQKSKTHEPNKDKRKHRECDSGGSIGVSKTSLMEKMTDCRIHSTTGALTSLPDDQHLHMTDEDGKQSGAENSPQKKKAKLAFKTLSTAVMHRHPNVSFELSKNRVYIYSPYEPATISSPERPVSHGQPIGIPSVKEQTCMPTPSTEAATNAVEELLIERPVEPNNRTDLAEHILLPNDKKFPTASMSLQCLPNSIGNHSTGESAIEQSSIESPVSQSCAANKSGLTILASDEFEPSLSTSCAASSLSPKEPSPKKPFPKKPSPKKPSMIVRRRHSVEAPHSKSESSNNQTLSESDMEKLREILSVPLTVSERSKHSTTPVKRLPGNESHSTPCKQRIVKCTSNWKQKCSRSPDVNNPTPQAELATDSPRDPFSCSEQVLSYRNFLQGMTNPWARFGDSNQDNINGDYRFNLSVDQSAVSILSNSLNKTVDETLLRPLQLWCDECDPEVDKLQALLQRLSISDSISDSLELSSADSVFEDVNTEPSHSSPVPSVRPTVSSTPRPGKPISHKAVSAISEPVNVKQLIPKTLPHQPTPEPSSDIATTNTLMLESVAGKLSIDPTTLSGCKITVSKLRLLADKPEDQFWERCPFYDRCMCVQVHCSRTLSQIGVGVTQSLDIEAIRLAVHYQSSRSILHDVLINYDAKLFKHLSGADRVRTVEKLLRNSGDRSAESVMLPHGDINRHVPLKGLTVNVTRLNVPADVPRQTNKKPSSTCALAKENQENEVTYIPDAVSSMSSKTQSVLTRVMSSKVNTCVTERDHRSKDIKAERTKTASLVEPPKDVKKAAHTESSKKELIASRYDDKRRRDTGSTMFSIRRHLDDMNPAFTARLADDVCQDIAHAVNDLKMLSEDAANGINRLQENNSRSFYRRNGACRPASVENRFRGVQLSRRTYREYRLRAQAEAEQYIRKNKPAKPATANI